MEIVRHAVLGLTSFPLTTATIMALCDVSAALVNEIVRNPRMTQTHHMS